MRTDMPSLAVVIPCYNAERWLKRAIDSVLEQKYPRLELIVVDDGSTDNSLQIAQLYGPPVRILTGPNRGACFARNRGLSAVAAEYVQFLDADDWLEGDILAGSITRAEQTGADIVFSQMFVRYLDGREETRGNFPEPLSPEFLFKNWFRNGFAINPSATLWRTQFLKRIGGWNDAVLINQDGELIARALLEGARVAQNKRGRGVYNKAIEGSLSKQISKQKVENFVDTLDTLLALAKRSRFASCDGELKRTLYGVARFAFRKGYRAIGMRALQVLRSHGCDQHFGSRIHRVVSSVIGLEAKVRFFEGLVAAAGNREPHLGCGS